MEGSNKSHHGDANYSGGFASVRSPPPLFFLLPRPSFHFHFTPSAKGSMVPILNAGETKACSDSGALHSSQTLANPR